MKASEKALMCARFRLSATCRCERAPMAVEDGTGLNLHIPAYARVFVFVWIWVSPHHACQPITHGSAATTLARAVSVSAGWQRRETLSAAHPGEEGLPAHLLSHHLGPCVCGCSAPDPLGSSQCRRTSALSNLLVKRENNNQQPQLSYALLCILTAYSYTFIWRQQPEKQSVLTVLNIFTYFFHNWFQIYPIFVFFLLLQEKIVG